jgi:hypothetical protein
MARGTGQCPNCGEAAALGPDNPVRPFCGPRCKLADLHRWLDGGYRIPAEPVSPDGDARGWEDDPESTRS